MNPTSHHPLLSPHSRREFLNATARVVAGSSLVIPSARLFGQLAGERPPAATGVKVINPRARIPVGLIIDDSTCLVNLNRFAMPQFDEVYQGKNPAYKQPWRDWPAEIPDSFVRKFGEWAAAEGIKGKFSIVPYPACVGRLDRMLPGWTQKELQESLNLVRTVMVPNWDIHPEMVTHTRVIDPSTGHSYPEFSLRFMENWDWTTGRSVDELAQYETYALQILKNAGLTCEGITTPGGFGNQALPELAQATLQSVRSVFNAEVPHYFRHLYDSGDQSVAPRVEYASDLNGPDPRCVVSIIGCTGDWTGGWDCTKPGGVDRFITEDLQRGRVVDVIKRGEPAVMVCHWTGIYWNGQELGFKIFQEVVRRLRARFNNLLWMKLGELARYWAAKELTRLEPNGGTISIKAPFACPDFTLEVDAKGTAAPSVRTVGGEQATLKEAGDLLKLNSGIWFRRGDRLTVCFALPKGESQLSFV